MSYRGQDEKEAVFSFLGWAESLGSLPRGKEMFVYYSIYVCICVCICVCILQYVLYTTVYVCTLQYMFVHYSIYLYTTVYLYAIVEVTFIGIMR